MARVRIVDIGPRASQPNLDDPIHELRYIGPHFSAQLVANGVTTMRDLRNLLIGQSKRANRNFLRRVLVNPRRRIAGIQDGCLGVASRRGGGAAPRYKVRQNNVFAYNAIIQWFRERGAGRVRGGRRNIYATVVRNNLPDPMQLRTYATAWDANYCP